ncbi:MAG: malto-oligosyltrehalose synthase [Candidatus Sulfobium sp.]|jgi:(1->4)-alpha-D-glucan 1-alpha-D-glucosylmutase
MEDKGVSPRIPAATYRLQFNGSFRFGDAGDIVAYLNDLGITDIYASPYLKAKKGSTHGYDIVDHNSLNPEVGTEEEYVEYVAELQKYGMGQILDIVPNHMYIESSENTLWMDVLENGPSSVYAHFFDIDWAPVKKELRNKVLLPVLGDQYGRVLDNGELRLSFDEGSFCLHYYDHRFPVVPKTYNTLLEHGIEALEECLTGEHPDLVELLSIITALNHLPPYTEMSPEKVAERHREKEIIKKRLLKLYGNSTAIKEHIDENVRIFNGVRGEPRTFDLLDELLDMQVYRLSYWRVAMEEINYRRFFDINHLAAIRMEDPEVFRETHRLIMKLIRRRRITGLRVDHPDGLYDPSEYFHRLQLSCYSQLRSGRGGDAEDDVPLASSPEMEPAVVVLYNDLFSPDSDRKLPFYIVGEKILIKGERIPEEWPIFSTTGYVFLNSLNGIFVETRSARAFDNIYKKFTGLNLNYQDVVYEKKKLIMEVAMSSEVNTLGHYLNRMSEKDRHTRDFTLNSLTHAILEVIAYFPVYRTYINSYDVMDRDRQYVESAVSKAKRDNPAISGSIFDFLKDVLLMRLPENIEEADKEEWLDFVMRFQQITGPVMAKGLEDTAFYVYNRLISLNEVGGAPDRFGTSIETFHGQNIERMKSWPHALIASSTHDTKRSEDVRARINVLSEMPDEWRRHLALWRRLNRKKRLLVDGQFVPDRNEEYLFYQTLVGAWPIGEMDEAGLEGFRERIRSYMLKAIREAKVNTSWVNPNTVYEDAIMVFADSVLSSGPGNQFLREFAPFQRKISHFGMFNSLSQTLLKITCPGVPDFYQGTEIWDLSLVDPDNRRPVDYGMRAEMLRRLKDREAQTSGHDLSRELTLNKETGEIKLYVTYKTLGYRRMNREIFEEGDYVPLETGGGAADHICAFARRLGDREVIVVVPRFLIRLVFEDGRLPLGPEVWEDSAVIVPFAVEGQAYRNIFTSETVKVQLKNGALCLPAPEVFANLPVALLGKVD